VRAVELTLARERARRHALEERERLAAHEAEQRRLAMESSPNYRISMLEKELAELRARQTQGAA
jgi:hypothetical protein